MHVWISRRGAAPERVVVADTDPGRLRARLAADDAVILNFGPERIRLFKPRTPALEIELFCQSLLSLLRAGLSIVESVEALIAEDGRFGELGRVLEALRRGFRFSDALKEQVNFPSLLIALIRAAEKTSDVPTALEKYAQYASQIRRLKQTVRSALLYPFLLSIVGSAVLLFLAFYVVPRFSLIYEGMKGSLPWSARIMLSWGQYVRSNWVVLVGAIVGTFACAIYALSRRSTLAKIGEAATAAPMFGTPLQVFRLARLYRTLGMLLAGGMPFLTAVRMAFPVLPDHLHGRLSQVEQAIRNGGKPSEALESSGLTTSISSRMLVAGERSGDLGTMMLKIADFYDAALERQLSDTMRIVEPIVMAIVGIGVGLVVVLMYLPIFDLASSIQ